MLVELLAFVNLCFTDGIKFYYSNKFIIVSPGDEDGCLLPKYFSKAINLRSGELTKFILQSKFTATVLIMSVLILVDMLLCIEHGYIILCKKAKKQVQCLLKVHHTSIF